ncbi:unnamed protein product [Durusdinium trenchii]|uniref:Uncharacterized protein n=1 Tax=Durusdinium trenchii TaxID=1381693 RepID=A0ABP0JKW8_9DINO
MHGRWILELETDNEAYSCLAGLGILRSPDLQGFGTDDVCQEENSAAADEMEVIAFQELPVALSSTLRFASFHPFGASCARECEVAMGGLQRSIEVPVPTQSTSLKCPTKHRAGSWVLLKVPVLKFQTSKVLSNLASHRGLHLVSTDRRSTVERQCTGAMLSGSGLHPSIPGDA